MRYVNLLDYNEQQSSNTETSKDLPEHWGECSFPSISVAIYSYILASYALKCVNIFVNYIATS